MVTVKFGDVSATVDNGTWNSDDAELVELLNAMWPTEGFPGSEPDPDYAAAEIAAERLGGRIVSADEVPFDPEAIY